MAARGVLAGQDLTPDLLILFWVRIHVPILVKTHRAQNYNYFTEMGTFVHAVEGEMLCTSTMPEKVPYFNAPIYLQNKSVIGKVDEILGPINEVYFSVKMGEGMVANSFKKGDKVYIGGDKLLPLERFLPKPKVPGGEVVRLRSFCRFLIKLFRCQSVLGYRHAHV